MRTMQGSSLNAVYSRPTMRRRYEVWFLKLLLADGSGAWWFRYLLMNPGRPKGGGCPGDPRGMPVQLWATWFPQAAKPQGFIQGFPLSQLCLSNPGGTPFGLRCGDSFIGEDCCAGRLEAEGHQVTWKLDYSSTLGATLSDVGWIGFSRTPHSDAVYSGVITFDGRQWEGQPLGFGLQGHNCGFRHRHLWNWAHGIALPSDAGGMSTFEALVYEVPLGLHFHKALLWHEGRLHVFRRIRSLYRDRRNLQWAIHCADKNEEFSMLAVFDGSGPSAHRLPYLKTDCSSMFEVANNSLARATLHLFHDDRGLHTMAANGGAVLEMVGP